MISPISCCLITRLSRHFIKSSPLSIQGSLSKFSRILAAKTLKNSYFFLTVTFKISYKGKRTKIRKEKSKVTYSVALIVAFLASEHENPQLKDLPQFLKIYLLSVRKKWLTEKFFGSKVTPIVFLFVCLFVFLFFLLFICLFFVVIWRIFPSWALATFFGDYRSYSFLIYIHSIAKTLTHNKRL